MDRRTFLLSVGLLSCGVGGYWGWAKGQAQYPAKIRQRAEALGKHHGILIGFGTPDSFFVPPYTVEDSHIKGGVATAVELESLPPALDGIEQSLSLYPPGYIATLCKAIFVCGSLTLDGAQAGGTYGKAWIILVANKVVGEDGILETARLGVHHEFSSLVWNHIPGLGLRWASLLPQGWEPATDNAQALKALDRGEMDFSEGFLSPYGKTTLENDFNVYAETLFTDPRRIQELAGKFGLVAQKVSLLMTAYRELDDRILTMFENMGLSSLLEVKADKLRDEIKVSPLVIPRGAVQP